MAATEQFINELEGQLQQARSDLLAAKLQISDQSVEIDNLKAKLQAQIEQVSHYVEERRNFEESFENLRSQLEILQSEKLELSQMVKDRESSLHPMQLQHAMFGNQSHNGAEMNQTATNPLQTPFNLSASFNRQELQKQIETLNKQVFEATKK